ncbi:alcohol dehydrogenase [Macrophomina phaseolina]|uniref:Alcohol dehydrogenase n=1 Tax=Macrophomina phaseolina TaxID=35725 RepID=A0ABQ8G315_9PEZI|nr:alcohol dehydrogenase [Macrophomina phaseolina]
MRAQVLEAFNEPYVLRDIPSPPSTPSGQDLLIAVKAASYCHTDAVFASGAMQWRSLPRVGSHEFAGTILALGPNVPADLDLAVGQRVGVPGRAFHCCGTCRECTAHNGGDRAGYGVHCTKAGNLGLSADGGFQERCVVDACQVAPVPEGLAAVEVAPLMCAGLTIWNALERGGVRLDGCGVGNDGVRVAISGAGGGLGHLGVQFAVKLGCEVVALEASDKALELLQEVVRELGALGKRVTIVDVRKEKAEEVRFAVCGAPDEPALEGEKGVDCALVLPEAQAALDYCMKLLRNHGTCVCVSFPKEGFQFQPADLVFRHINMVGVLVGRNRQLRAMLNFAATQGVRAKTTTYPLERLNELVEDYHKGVSGKLVIDMAL